MTKQEIKDLVAAKIAGQGSMVDAGGGLPTILNEIIDLIPEGGGLSFPQIITSRALTDEEIQALVATGIAVAPDGKLCTLCTDSQLVESFAEQGITEIVKLFLYAYTSDSGERYYEGYLFFVNEQGSHWCKFVES